TITVRNTATGTTRTATTDPAGRYRIPALDAGPYDLRAELQTFKTVVRTGVVLAVGGTTDVDVTMSVGTIYDEGTVSGAAPLVGPSRVEMSRIVSAIEIE